MRFVQVVYFFIPVARLAPELGVEVAEFRVDGFCVHVMDDLCLGFQIFIYRRVRKKRIIYDAHNA